MTRKKIHGNLGFILTLLGRLYGTPANAIKEYISNALDEYVKAGELSKPCKVHYRLERDRITIDYSSPGMDANEFDAALNRVADSAKKNMSVRQIGELGIGIFAFNQVGSTCTFFSKKEKGSPTIKVILTGNSDEYEIETARKFEARQDVGMTIVITRLHQDPTKPRGSLSPSILKRFFAEKFDSYLREGKLQVDVACGDSVYEVKPIEVGLPKVGEAFAEAHLSSDWKKIFRCQFWFDSSGKGRVSIRHTGVTIIEDIKLSLAYGLEDSVYGSGLLKGYIDADFLTPLPARTSFEENDDWVKLLIELDRIRPSIESEVEDLQRQEDEKTMTEVQKRAIELSRDILEQEQFRDLEFLGGLSKPRSPIINPGVRHKRGQDTGERSRKSGSRERRGSFRISYKEEPFEDGSSRHSEFIAGTVRVNTINPDFIRERKGSEQTKVAYAALMIGKETITHASKSADYYLEKLLSFLFQVKSKTPESFGKNRSKLMLKKIRQVGISPKLL